MWVWYTPWMSNPKYQFCLVSQACDDTAELGGYHLWPSQSEWMVPGTVREDD